jgi:hypothetical protein
MYAYIYASAIVVVETMAMTMAIPFSHARPLTYVLQYEVYCVSWIIITTNGH